MKQKHIALLLLLISMCFHSKAQLFDEAPENVIIIVANGLGQAELSALYAAGNKAPQVLRFEYTGFISNKSADNEIADNAAFGSAIACGQKTPNGVIGLDSSGNAVPSLMKIARDKGKRTGIVTLGSFTSPIPASFYAHQKLSRANERIALDLLNSDIDLLIGGGSQFLTHRIDGRDLEKELRIKKYKFYDQVKDLEKRNSKKTIALLSETGIGRIRDRKNFLGQAWERALKVLLKNDNESGFFLVIDNPHIAWAQQINNKDYLLEELEDTDKLIGGIMDFLGHDKKTLILVVSANAYGGLVLNDSNTKKKSSLSWTNKKQNPGLSLVFAHGPGAELFSGYYPNTDIFNKIKTLLEY